MKALGTLLLVLLLAVGVAAWELESTAGPDKPVLVDIPAGTGTPGIAERLHDAGVIHSALTFELYREVKGGRLKAGVYQFEGPMTVGEVYAKLRRGDVYTKTLVIPEGFNLFDIAAAVEKAGLAPAADFLKAAHAQTALIAEWNPEASSLEGFLFPDTYRFSPHATPTDMVTAMVKRFRQEAKKLGMTSLSGADVYRDVTMASLIEREVHVPAERARVAGVFENRLRAGMPLQTDPSVVYASMLAGTWTGVIHQSELHSESPYNTYTHTGLPPGPVCNPGVASLTAALHPEANDFLYFVAEPNGGTKFAATLAEHNANVAAYRAAMGIAPPVPGPPPASMQPKIPSALDHAPKHTHAPKVRREIVRRHEKSRIIAAELGHARRLG